MGNLLGKIFLEKSSWKNLCGESLLRIFSFDLFGKSFWGGSFWGIFMGNVEGNLFRESFWGIFVENLFVESLGNLLGKYLWAIFLGNLF